MAKSPVTEKFDQNVSRQRIDYNQLPDGTVQAILTVTLPGGIQNVYIADVSPQEAQVVSGAWDEIAAMDVAGEIPWGEVGFSLGGLFKGVVKSVKSVVMHPINVIRNPKNLFKPPDMPIFNKEFQKLHKKVDDVAKKVATSKVFKQAAAGLAVAAPFLGPVAPIALGAAGAMTIANKVMSARVAAEKGAKGVATALMAEATGQAKQLAPKNFKELLTVANDKAKGALSLASSVKPKPAPKGKRAPVPTAAVARTALKAASKARATAPARAPGAALAPASGRKLSANELLTAARAGKVYVIRAG